jgi:arginyl-tRNA synthetase
MSRATLTDRIDAVLGQVFALLSLPSEFARSAATARHAAADLQCNGATRAAKALSRDPREVANAIAAVLAERPEFSEVSVEGQGFINLTLSPMLLAELAEVQARTGSRDSNSNPARADRDRLRRPQRGETTSRSHIVWITDSASDSKAGAKGR